MKKDTTSKATSKQAPASKKAASKTAMPSLKVRKHAKKIMSSLDEAEQIFAGKKEGRTFDDFLAGF